MSDGPADSHTALTDDAQLQASFDPALRQSLAHPPADVPRDLADPRRVKLHADRLRLSGDGIFCSLQGEGVTLGMPAVFLRLHVCNLRCRWCDARYTWDPATREFWSESYERSVDDVAAEIRRAWPADAAGITPRLVITGGEPLLQRRPLDALLERLPQWAAEIETNGTIMPTDAQLARCQFNCSPKLAHSGNSRHASIRPDILQRLAQANTQFKFVVMQPGDVDELRRDFLPHIKPEQVILMPQGITPEELRRRTGDIADTAQRHGYRLLPRLHIHLWGNRRGT